MNQYHKILIVESIDSDDKHINQMIIWEHDNQKLWKLEFYNNDSILTKLKKWLLDKRKIISLARSQISSILTVLLPEAENIIHDTKQLKLVDDLEMSHELSYIYLSSHKKEIFLNRQEFDDFVSILANIVI